LSGVVRGSLFFATNITAGVTAAARATAIECALGVPVVGVLAAVIQAFRAAEPRWAATLVTAGLLPAIVQLAELTVHWRAGTPQLGASMLASVSLSVLSTLFNLFAMRRGVMIVGRGARRFRDDIRQVPGLVAAFLMTLPRAIGRARLSIVGSKTPEACSRRYITKSRRVGEDHEGLDQKTSCSS
jgi:hypothetical protein